MSSARLQGTRSIFKEATVFLYLRDEQSKCEIKKIITLQLHQKTLRNKFNKDLNIETNKLLKEIKEDLNKMKKQAICVDRKFK